jgi:frataxin-like iron-binding protein CyaY
MKLIKPSQISGEIMTLIEEADKKLIIVSPYCKFSDWKKFINTINFLKRKKTAVEFYVREGESKTNDEVEKIGFNPISVPNLHTKLYINEKYAIVSSMNLLTYSDMNSLDIAYQTETESEYNELIEYYERYLKIFKGSELKIENNIYSKEKHYKNIENGNWIEYLSDLISNELETNCRIQINESSIDIQCGNIYEAFINKTKNGNNLNILGIISGKEFEILETEKVAFKEHSRLDVTLKEGNGNSYNTAWHHSKIKLESSKIDYLYKTDYNSVVQIIYDFIINLQDFKQHCRTIKI